MCDVVNDDAQTDVGGDVLAGFPSFTDVMPWVIQEKVLEHLRWRDVGRAASTCRAWRAYFKALDDVPTWKSTFSREAQFSFDVIQSMMNKLLSPARPDLCVFFVCRDQAKWQGLTRGQMLRHVGSAIASHLPGRLGVSRSHSASSSSHSHVTRCLRTRASPPLPCVRRQPPPPFTPTICQTAHEEKRNESGFCLVTRYFSANSD